MCEKFSKTMCVQALALCEKSGGGEEVRVSRGLRPRDLSLRLRLYSVSLAVSLGVLGISALRSSGKITPMDQSSFGIRKRVSKSCASMPSLLVGTGGAFGVVRVGEGLRSISNRGLVMVPCPMLGGLVAPLGVVGRSR